MWSSLAHSTSKRSWPSTHTGSTPLLCDNKAALSIVANLVQHERTKHIKVDCHFTREKHQSGIIEPQYVSYKKQLDDIFTKSLLVFQHQHLLLKLVAHASHLLPTWRGVLTVRCCELLWAGVCFCVCAAVCALSHSPLLYYLWYSPAACPLVYSFYPCHIMYKNECRVPCVKEGCVLTSIYIYM